MANILLPARLLLSGHMIKKVRAFWASSIRNMVWLMEGAFLQNLARTMTHTFLSIRMGGFKLSI